MNYVQYTDEQNATARHINGQFGNARTSNIYRNSWSLWAVFTTRGHWDWGRSWQVCGEEPQRATGWMTVGAWREWLNGHCSCWSEARYPLNNRHWRCLHDYTVISGCSQCCMGEVSLSLTHSVSFMQVGRATADFVCGSWCGFDDGKVWWSVRITDVGQWVDAVPVKCLPSVCAVSNTLEGVCIAMATARVAELWSRCSTLVVARRVALLWNHAQCCRLALSAIKGDTGVTQAHMARLRSVGNCERPRALWRFAPVKHRHEGPGIKSFRIDKVTITIREKFGASSLWRC